MTSAPPVGSAAADEYDAHEAADMAEATEPQFSRPTPMPPARALAFDLAARREDDPPPEVPRDQWERPLIVLPNGSGVIAYTRASKYGKLIRNQRALIKWDERNIVYGMSRGHHLVARASGVRTLTAGPDIATLEDIAEQAKTIAGAHAGAMTGSGLHALHARRASGEDLSWLDPTLMQCLDAITTLLDPRIFEILVTEGDDDLGRTFVIHDELQGAGSFDLVVRLLRDLTWPDGVTVPRGTILVVDLKTGKITSAPYWDTEFSCQQLIYADGIPYRPGRTHLANPKVRSAKNVIKVTGQPGVHGRIGWDEIGIPGGPDHRYSLILHVPAMTPGDAHWERVDLDEARRDAHVARQAHARARVDRSQRFLALPAAALLVGGVDLPAPAEQDQLPRKNEALRAALAIRISRADTQDKVNLIYDAWHGSPSWDDELTNACGDRWEALDTPDPDCAQCSSDTHQCPACGRPVAHGVTTCPPCGLRVDLETADSRAAINVLWIAHGPDGDGLWADEHQNAGITRYQALPATPDWPDLEDVADEPAEPDEDDEQRPETDAYDAAQDPAHPITAAHDSALIKGYADRLAALGVASDEALRLMREDGLTAEQAAAAVAGPGDPIREPELAEPGPFDRTMDLSDLRDKIDQALDTDTLDALYDAHCPVAEGGDGLWTDDLDAVAQAAYDRITGGTEAAS